MFGIKKFIDYHRAFKQEQELKVIIESLENDLGIVCREFDQYLKSDLFKMSQIQSDPIYKEAIENFKQQEQLLTEAASELPSNLRGGIIYFSPEVNAVVDAGGSGSIRSKMLGFFKKKLATLKNELQTDKLLDQAREAVKQKYGKEIFGRTLEKGLKGTYYFTDPETGVTTSYNEKSMAITVVGVDTRTLIAFATRIADLFQQQEVMLHDYNTGKIRFIKSKSERIKIRKNKK
jgi:hypothetical protein